MLSAHLHMARDHRCDTQMHLGLSDLSVTENVSNMPKVWIGSAKIPPHGKGLADKGLSMQIIFSPG